jgi:hypothetical protein
VKRLQTLYGRDLEVADWVVRQIPHMAVRVPYFPPGMVFGPPAAIGVIDEAGLLIAGVVFHNHDPFVGNIEVSCAAISPRWGNRDIFREILRYPFLQLGCRRVTAVTPRRATSPRQFLEGLGFKREGSARFGFGSDNAIIYGLLAEEWSAGRFCAPRGSRGLSVGQEHPEAAACA